MVSCLLLSLLLRFENSVTFVTLQRLVMQSLQALTQRWRKGLVHIIQERLEPCDIAEMRNARGLSRVQS